MSRQASGREANAKFYINAIFKTRKQNEDQITVLKKHGIVAGNRSVATCTSMVSAALTDFLFFFTGGQLYRI